MVTVTNYHVRKTKEDQFFITLELTGSVELLQSQVTGRFYATVKKTNIPATFSEDVAKRMIGCTLEGEVVRVPCDPYEYVVKRTGEVMKLAHTYSYRPNIAADLIGNTPVGDVFVN